MSARQTSSPPARESSREIQRLGIPYELVPSRSTVKWDSAEQEGAATDQFSLWSKEVLSLNAGVAFDEALLHRSPLFSVLAYMGAIFFTTAVCYVPAVALFLFHTEGSSLSVLLKLLLWSVVVWCVLLCVAISAELLTWHRTNEVVFELVLWLGQCFFISASVAAKHLMGSKPDMSLGALCGVVLVNGLLCVLSFCLTIFIYEVIMSRIYAERGGPTYRSCLIQAVRGRKMLRVTRGFELFALAKSVDRRPMGLDVPKLRNMATARLSASAEEINYIVSTVPCDEDPGIPERTLVIGGEEVEPDKFKIFRIHRSCGSASASRVVTENVENAASRHSPQPEAADVELSLDPFADLKTISAGKGTTSGRLGTRRVAAWLQKLDLFEEGSTSKNRVKAGPSIEEPWWIELKQKSDGTAMWHRVPPAILVNSGAWLNCIYLLVFALYLQSAVRLYAAHCGSSPARPAETDDSQICSTAQDCKEVCSDYLTFFAAANKQMRVSHLEIIGLNNAFMFIQTLVMAYRISEGPHLTLERKFLRNLPLPRVAIQQVVRALQVLESSLKLRTITKLWLGTARTLWKGMNDNLKATAEFQEAACGGPTDDRNAALARVMLPLSALDTGIACHSLPLPRVPAGMKSASYLSMWADTSAAWQASIDRYSLSSFQSDFKLAIDIRIHCKETWYAFRRFLLSDGDKGYRRQLSAILATSGAQDAQGKEPPQEVHVTQSIVLGSQVLPQGFCLTHLYAAGGLVHIVGPASAPEPGPGSQDLVEEYLSSLGGSEEEEPEAMPPWTITIDKTQVASMPRCDLGISYKAELGGLVLTGIEPEGLVAAWNASNPEKAARVDDVIFNVNGVQGCDGVLEECTRDGKLEMQLRNRYETSAYLQPFEGIGTGVRLKPARKESADPREDRRRDGGHARVESIVARFQLSEQYFSAMLQGQCPSGMVSFVSALLDPSALQKALLASDSRTSFEDLGGSAPVCLAGAKLVSSESDDSHASDCCEEAADLHIMMPDISSDKKLGLLSFNIAFKLARYGSTVIVPATAPVVRMLLQGGAMFPQAVAMPLLLATALQVVGLAMLSSLFQDSIARFTWILWMLYLFEVGTLEPVEDKAAAKAGSEVQAQVTEAASNGTGGGIKPLIGAREPRNPFDLYVRTSQAYKPGMPYWEDQWKRKRRNVEDWISCQSYLRVFASTGRMASETALFAAIFILLLCVFFSLLQVWQGKGAIGVNQEALQKRMSHDGVQGLKAGAAAGEDLARHAAQHVSTATAAAASHAAHAAAHGRRLLVAAVPAAQVDIVGLRARLQPFRDALLTPVRRQVVLLTGGRRLGVADKAAKYAAAADFQVDVSKITKTQLVTLVTVIVLSFYAVPLIGVIAAINGMFDKHAGLLLAQKEKHRQHQAQREQLEIEKMEEERTEEERDVAAAPADVEDTATGLAGDDANLTRQRETSRQLPKDPSLRRYEKSLDMAIESARDNVARYPLTLFGYAINFGMVVAFLALAAQNCGSQVGGLAPSLARSQCRLLLESDWLYDAQEIVNHTQHTMPVKIDVVKLAGSFCKRFVKNTTDILAEQLSESGKAHLVRVKEQEGSDDDGGEEGGGGRDGGRRLWELPALPPLAPEVDTWWAEQHPGLSAEAKFLAVRLLLEELEKDAERWLLGLPASLVAAHEAQGRLLAAEIGLAALAGAGPSGSTGGGAGGTSGGASAASAPLASR